MPDEPKALQTLKLDDLPTGLMDRAEVMYAIGARANACALLLGYREVLRDESPAKKWLRALDAIDQGIDHAFPAHESSYIKHRAYTTARERIDDILARMRTDSATTSAPQAGGITQEAP